jgi:hypothetical protein
LKILPPVICRQPSLLGYAPSNGSADIGSERAIDELRSRLRSAISPWLDRRQKLDIIRDKLEEGEFVLFVIGTHALIPLSDRRLV